MNDQDIAGIICAAIVCLNVIAFILVRHNLKREKKNALIAEAEKYESE